jgi:copper resistance protein B
MTSRVASAAAFAAALFTAASARAQMPGMPSMPHHDMRWSNTLFVLVDQLEYAPGSDGRVIGLDASVWYGGSRTRAWLRAEGETATTEAEGEAEAQLLLGRLIDPFWDAVAGVRVDQGWGGDGNDRVQLAVGLIGLAPYRFELEPTLFVSHRGEVSARLEAAYTILVTQRLMAEPEIEINASLQDVPQYGLGRGVNDYEAGIRFRYEIRREFAPYVGWVRSWQAGEGGVHGGGASTVTNFVAGFRFWR